MKSSTDVASGPMTLSTLEWLMSARATGRRPRARRRRRPSGAWPAAYVLREDGVLLVRHGGGALLARPNGSMASMHLGALQVPDLGGCLLGAGADDREGAETRRGDPAGGSGCLSGRAGARASCTPTPRPRGARSRRCPRRLIPCRGDTGEGVPHPVEVSAHVRIHSANLSPNAIGSACTPWERPMAGKSLNS